jgi:hypothetical protein
MTQGSTGLSSRRLVTGNDAGGKSRLVDDRDILEGAGGNYNHWSIQTANVRPDSEVLDQTQPFFPEAGQVFFRQFRIPPTEPGTPPAVLDKIAQDMFGHFGIADCRIDTSRHPMMHRTPTIDYVVLLSGEASLLLDHGDPIPLKPFDVVVQRATNHAWINTGKGDAIFIAIMVGAP